LKTTPLDLLTDAGFYSLDIFLFLVLQIAPKLLQPSLAFRIGYVLVVPPQGIKPFAEFVHQVMIVSIFSHLGETCASNAGPFSSDIILSR
jgi:hypothetical protein